MDNFIFKIFCHLILSYHLPPSLLYRLVVKSGNFCPTERDLENCVAAAVAQIMAMFRKNGGFSKITIVYDRSNFSMSENLDKPLLKAMANIFSNNYPETLHAALLYPCGFVLRGIWAVVKYFFDYKTRQKIFMLAGPDSFQEHIDPDQLLEECGGTSTFKYNHDEFISSYPKVCHDPWQGGETEEETTTATMEKETTA